MIETFAVCLTTLGGLQLVLRFLERRETAKTATVTASTESELREALKSADMRLSKLEMRQMAGR